MRCEEVRQFLSPYIDSELDDKTTFLIGRHLDDCPECATRFRQEEELELAISQRLRRPTGDETTVFHGALKRALAARRHPRRRLSLAVAAATLFVLTPVLAFYFYFSSGDLPDLVAAAAADHTKSVRGELAPQVGGEEPEALAEFLSESLGAEVKFHLPSTGWTVDGARLCRLRSVKVGLIMLRRGTTPVSLFVVPGSEAKKFPETRDVAPRNPRFQVQGGYGVVSVNDDGALYCAIGDLAPESLEGLLASAR